MGLVMEFYDEEVKSPCIGVCRLNDQQVCTGCFRTLKEIGEWGRVDNERRRSIVQDALSRISDELGIE